MVEQSDGLCHIQEGFFPTDIHLSYIHIAPAFKPEYADKTKQIKALA